MTNDILVAVIVIAFILPIATFLLGYYYSCSKLHNVMIKSKIKCVELDIKLKEAKLKELNHEIDRIVDRNPKEYQLQKLDKSKTNNVHVFEFSEEDEEDLNALLNALGALEKNKKNNDSDKDKK